jgi:ubiquinone biosynthesis protein COQ9
MNQPLAERILDSALNLAEESSWEAMHLYEIAEALDITLDQIRRHYPQKDDLVEAWFDRADRAILQMTPSPEFIQWPEVDRLHYVIMTWFDALASHRWLTRQMLAYKLEFGHVHLQTLGIMRISRTVQWFREAARGESLDLKRIVEEIGTTAIYLMSFTRWLYDDSLGSEKTRSFLKRQLRRAERLEKLFGRR